MKLYSGPLSMFGAKAQIAALEKGLDVDVEMVPFKLWGSPRYDPVHPEVARVNAKRQVPVLVDGPLEIADSTQIMEYFEDLRPTPPLWPASIRDRATARQLEMKADEVWFPKFARLAELIGNADHAEGDAIRAAVLAVYEEAEGLLKGREYLAGAYSYADIAFYTAQLFGAILGRPIPETLIELTRWRARMDARPAVAAVVTPILDFLKSNGVPAPAYAAA